MTTTLANRFRRQRHLGCALLAAMAFAALTGCSGSSEPSGAYEAKGRGGTMTLEFKSGKKVVMTTQATAGGQPLATDGAYVIDGNKVTVQMPGGPPLILVRDGNTLDCDVMGETFHFHKK